MKSVVNKNDNNRCRSYPKIMESTGHIVLFETKRSGTVLNRLKDGAYSIGVYREDWCADSFKDFEGSVTLSND
jgi:hypothetical protein